MSCDVCEGTPGRYPIHNSRGREVMTIECPACGGTGCTEEEWESHLQEVSDRMRYDAAMAEMRGQNKA